MTEAFPPNPAPAPEPQQTAPPQAPPAPAAPPHSAPPANLAVAPASAPTPVSAPVSGPWLYPTTGYPVAIQPPVPTRTGPLLWVLVGVSALLLVGIGVLAYLQAAEKASGKDEIAKQDAQITDLSDQIRDLQRGNENRQDDITDARDDLQDNRDLIADLERCPEAIQNYVNSFDGSEAEFQQAVQQVFATCHI